ncbi:MAG: D-2-hydroxyacid dehydrogenase [Bryobacteraceae bacterium]|nr:D-2-hydroxyacid dehydrogenase [Solibacteraceae bacterium]MCO5350828.1 D-2-hydroxyacid dehydrogenase [Bryobacteraceae bacterium]
MPNTTLLVLHDPTARHLALLDRLPQDLRIVASDKAEGLRAAAPEAQAMLVGGGPFRGELETLWPELRNLRWIHALSAGLEGLLFPQLVESPMVLTNSAGVFARSLGEFALAGMLHFAKDLARMKRQQAASDWTCFDVDELHGRTLAILGFGGIGRAAATRARAFGMHIHALRRSPAAPDPLVDRWFIGDQLDEMLGSADYLLVSAPLTPATRGLIDARRLALLPRHAVLINLGRGPVVDEAALVSALAGRCIRGAVLDVFDQEPLPPGHPFWALDNVLLSPHTADHTATWLTEAMEFFLANFERWYAGQPLHNITRKHEGY